MNNNIKKLFIACCLFCSVFFSYGQNGKIDTSAYFPNDIDYNLIIASEKGYVSEVKRLVKMGADVDSKTWEGVTPLMYAVQTSNKEIAGFLLSNNANPNLKPNNGVTALIAAIMSEDMEMAELLIRKGAEVNIGEKNGITPLMYTAAFNNIVLCDMLLYYNAWVNLQDNDGNTALMVAAYFGNIEIAKLLIDSDAELNLKDKKGFTALHAAVQNGYADIVKLLVDNGANLHNKTRSGESTLASAVHNQHYQVAKYILSDLPNPVQAYKPDNGILQYTIVQKNDSLANLLKSYGFKPDNKPKFNHYYLNGGMHFTGRDAFAGGGFGVKDTRFKFKGGIGFYTRLSAATVLVKQSELVYNQYHEHRSVFAASAGRDFNVLKFQDSKLVLSPTALYCVTYGKYKGSYNRPPARMFFAPGIDISIGGNGSGLFLNYRYMDFKAYNISNHRIGFGFYIFLNEPGFFRNNKKVIWYL